MSGPMELRLPLAEAHQLWQSATDFADAAAVEAIERGEDPFAPLQAAGECGVCGAWVEGPADVDQFDGPCIGWDSETQRYEVDGWSYVRCPAHIGQPEQGGAA